MIAAITTAMTTASSVYKSITLRAGTCCYLNSGFHPLTLASSATQASTISGQQLSPSDAI